ncbi:hypothetical protein GQ54DRAFT_201664 [Martensiomyces pterosporus]|nr:hypothetical protein GQ54DRAFT_201664 [Martensiomyces pterosporus]
MGDPASASAILRSVWRGSKQLVGAKNRLRTDAFIKLLVQLNWRELGSLLAQLVKLISEKEAKWTASKQTDLPSTIRCVTALAATLVHMLTAFASVAGTEEGLTPVHTKFVSKLFAELLYVTECIRVNFPTEYEAVAHQVFKATSLILAANDGYAFKQGESATLDADAVVDAITWPAKKRGNGNSGNGGNSKEKRERRNDIDGRERSTKRQRMDRSPSHVDASTNHHANSTDASDQLEKTDYTVLLASTLADRRCARAHGYIVQILRARSGIVAKRLLAGSQGGDQLCLIQAIVDQGRGILASGKADSNGHYTAGVFALIRDTISLAQIGDLEALSEQEATLVASVAQQCTDLSAAFRGKVQQGSSECLYRYCSEKRYRCYQWAALCRITTWLIRYSCDDLPGDVCKAVAEGSRTCWLQFVDAQQTHIDPSVSLVWSLLLSESLNQFALKYPNVHGSSTVVAAAGQDGSADRLAVRPLFLRSVWAQSRFFAALASIIARIGQILSAAAEQSGATLPLLLNILSVCDWCLRSISTEGASMGLFRPYNSLLTVECSNFSPSKCTLDEFVFSSAPSIQSQRSNGSKAASTAANGANEEAQPRKGPSDFDEQQREAFEEAEIEAKLAAIFESMDSLISMSANKPDSANTQPSALVLVALQTTMHWIHSFAVSARSNAGKQVRQLERQQRVKVRVVGEHARPHKSATDWSRLQRLPVLWSSERALRDVVMRVVRFLAGISAWKVLDDCESALNRCLAWSGDRSGNEVGDAGEIASCCRMLESSLSEQRFKYLSFSALQTLASMLGVPAYLSTTNLDAIRLPALQIRDHNPRSCETLVQETIRAGLCCLMLEPEIVAKFAGCVHSGRLLKEPLLLRSAQIWLDMIGSVAMHSLFRSYLCFFPESCSTSPTFGFGYWWSLALAAGTRCLIDISSSGQIEPNKIRLASILLSHLASWSIYLLADTGVLRSLSALHALYRVGEGVHAAENGHRDNTSLHRLLSWLSSFPHPPASKSVVYVVYFLACRLPLSLGVFETYSDEDEESVLRVSRDISGIASDLLRFLGRIIQHPVLRPAFLSLEAADEYITVLKRWLGKRQLPRLISEMLEADNIPGTTSPLFLAEEADLIAIPEFEPEAPSEDDDVDVVGRILHESAQSGSVSRTQLPVSECYARNVQGRLWSAYRDAMLRLPFSIVLCTLSPSEPSNQPHVQPVPKRADVMQCLMDENRLLFKLFTQLLSDKEAPTQHYDECDAISAAISLDNVLTALQNSIDNQPALSAMCVSAALLLPDSSESRPSACIDSIVPIVVDTLVHGLAGEDHERCATALCLMAWRQRSIILGHTSQVAVELQGNAAAQLERMGAIASQLRPLGILAKDGYMSSGEECHSSNDVVLLSAGGEAEISQPIATSLAVLVDVSPVFKAMLTGGFAEAQTSQGSIRHVSLQCSHRALANLFTIFHMLIAAKHASSPDRRGKQVRSRLERVSGYLDQEFTFEELACVLELASYYALHPVVSVLVWYFAQKTSALEMQRQSGGELTGAAVSFACHFDAYQFCETSAATLSRRSLAALILFCLSDADVATAIKEDVAAFLEDARFLLS